jgi:hypothetical protein
VVIDNQVLPGILHLLQNQQITESIMKEVCWTISNITVGTKEQVQVKITLDINNNNNNNNNNLFLRLLPSKHTKLVYETPLFVGQGTPSSRPRDLTRKVYESIHTLPYPPLDLKL